MVETTRFRNLLQMSQNGSSICQLLKVPSGHEMVLEGSGMIYLFKKRVKIWYLRSLELISELNCAPKVVFHQALSGMKCLGCTNSLNSKLKWNERILIQFSF